MRLATKSMTQVVLSLLISRSLAYSVDVRTRATTCNGSSDVSRPVLLVSPPLTVIAQLCDRSYGNVTFVGAHDSYAVGVNNREHAPYVQKSFGH